MASVVTFWQFPEEEERFLTYLEKTGDILACIGGPVTEPSRLEPRPVRELIECEDPDAVLIGPREFMEIAEIGSYWHEGRMLYSRFYAELPLVDYSRPRFRAPQKLEESNLVFKTSIWVSDGANHDLDHAEPQPPEFVAWARRVLNWMRRHTQRIGYRRVTPRVAAAVEDGLELVP